MSPTSYQAAPPRIERRTVAVARRMCQVARPSATTPSPRLHGTGTVAMLRGLDRARCPVSNAFDPLRGGLTSMRIRLAVAPVIVLIALIGRAPDAMSAAE